MEMTDPSLLSLLYDSGHLAFSGEDYVAVLERHVGRVRHVHLKDVRLPVLDLGQEGAHELPARGEGGSLHGPRGWRRELSHRFSACSTGRATGAGTSWKLSRYL